MPYWEDWMHGDSCFNMPSRIINLVPSADYVQKYLLNMEDALEISLVKWKQIKAVKSFPADLIAGIKKFAAGRRNRLNKIKTFTKILRYVKIILEIDKKKRLMRIKRNP